MADTPLTLTGPKLSEILADDIALAFNRQATISKVLKVRPAFNAAGPVWSVLEDTGHVATHAEGAEISDYVSDTRNKASLGFGMYSANFKVTDELRTRSAYSPSPSAEGNVYAHEIVLAVSRLTKAIEQDLHGGGGSNAIVGFSDAIEDDNTYATLNRSTEDYFRSYVAHNSGTPQALTLAQVRADLVGIKQNCGYRPDVAFLGPAVYAKFSALFDNNRVFAGVPGVNDVKGISFEGCTFIETSGNDGYEDSETSAIFYVDTSTTWIEALSYVGDDAVPGDALSSYFGFTELAKTGHNTKGAIRTMAQLVVSNPKACGKRLDITVV